MPVGEVVDGDCVLARRREMGRRFPLGCLAETPSQFGTPERDTFRMDILTETATQNIASEWDAVSGWHRLRKRRPILIMQNEKKELELRIVERLSSFSRASL